MSCHRAHRRPAKLLLAHLCAVLLLLCGTSAVAESHWRDLPVTALDENSRNLRLTHLGSAEGLRQELVNTIVQDAQGFMWFGTQEGLSRYDGQRIKNYTASAGTAGALAEDWIWALLTDQRGVLWAGTNGGGLARYRPRTDDFLLYRQISGGRNSLSSDRVRVLLEDSQGRIWIGTQGGGMDRFDPKLEQFTNFAHNADDPASLPENAISALAEDRDGNLWVGTQRRGLARFDPVTGTFTRFRADVDVPTALADDRIRSLYCDSNGNLWVATDNGGLHRFLPDRQIFERHQHDPDRLSSLPSNLVRDLQEDHNGDLWIATDRGLAQWLGGDQFVRYQHSASDRYGLHADPLTDLYEDRTGNLWIGSYEGVDKWNYVSDLFTYLDRNSGYLDNDLITALAEAPDGSLWIGSYGGGLTHYDRARNQVRRYRHDPDNPESVSDDRIMALTLDPSGQLWVGTRRGGLNRLDLASNRFQRIDNISATPSARGISSLASDPDGTVWVGVYGGGLTRLVPDAKTADAAPDSLSRTFFSHDPDNPRGLSTNKVVSIYRDRQQALWVGTEDGGLNRLDETSDTFERFMADPENPESLRSDAAWQIQDGSDGSLWIGTQGGGLSRWAPEDRQRGVFRLQHYSEASGLASDSVLGIVEDNDGQLWLSSNAGLTRFDHRTGSTRQFDSLNGLRGNEFLQGVALRSRNGGQLLFGSSAGVVAFSPAGLRAGNSRPPIAITAKSRDRILARGFSEDAVTPTIELAYPYYYLSFDFAALDFVSPDKNEFRYRLTGFEEDWIDPSDYPRATYTNLAPGSYDFQVKAANSDGLWNEEGVDIKVRVVPPPWRSNTAIALYAIFALLMLSGGYRVQRNKFEQAAAYQRQLESQVAERTAELESEKDKLADLNEKLTQASLTDPLTGLRNRRYFYEIITPMVAAIDRYYGNADCEQERLLFFMMIDLDGFKGLNDRYGHHAGDSALAHLASLLRGACRETDTVCRWGGDEFLIVGEIHDVREIERVAERLRSSVDLHRFAVEGSLSGQAPTAEGAHMTTSIGLSTYPLVPERPELASWETVSQLADQAAYIAKTSGKNRWVRLAGTADTDAAAVSAANQGAAPLVTSGALALTSNTAVTLPERAANS
ncbi:MAG: two-component regulator propeller domain-containing protein [Pseudomonadota bacterium]